MESQWHSSSFFISSSYVECHCVSHTRLTTLQGMSFMAIGFLYPSEINSNRSRNVGAAIAMVTNWIGVYIVVSITPIGKSHQYSQPPAK
jgi:hypothetical protein